MFKQVLFSDRGNFFKRYRHIIIDTYLSFTNQLNKLKDIVNSKSKSRVFSLVLDEPLSDWSLLHPIFGHIRSVGRRYWLSSSPLTCCRFYRFNSPLIASYTWPAHICFLNISIMSLTLITCTLRILFFLSCKGMSSIIRFIFTLSIIDIKRFEFKYKIICIHSLSCACVVASTKTSL